MPSLFSSLSWSEAEKQSREDAYINSINEWLGFSEEQWDATKETFEGHEKELTDVAFILSSYGRLRSQEISSQALILPLVFGVVLLESLGRLLAKSKSPSVNFAYIWQRYLSIHDEHLLYIHGNLLLDSSKSKMNHRHFVFSRMVRSKDKENYIYRTPDFCSCQHESETSFCECNLFLKSHLDKRASLRRYDTSKDRYVTRSAKLRYLASEHSGEILYKMRCAVLHDTHGSSYLYDYDSMSGGAPRSSYGMSIYDAIFDVKKKEYVHVMNGLEKQRFEVIIRDLVEMFLLDGTKFAKMR